MSKRREFSGSSPPCFVKFALCTAMYVELAMLRCTGDISTILSSEQLAAVCLNTAPRR